MPLPYPTAAHLETVGIDGLIFCFLLVDDSIFRYHYNNEQKASKDP